jgi:hypothetical protein
MWCHRTSAAEARNGGVYVVEVRSQKSEVRMFQSLCVEPRTAQGEVVERDRRRPSLPSVTHLSVCAARSETVRELWTAPAERSGRRRFGRREFMRR